MGREPVAAEFFGFQQELVGADVPFFHGNALICFEVIEAKGSRIADLDLLFLIICFS
ncbi:hypothetical protein D3C72_2472720 [compost metagenome]